MSSSVSSQVVGYSAAKIVELKRIIDVQHAVDQAVDTASESSSETLRITTLGRQHSRPCCTATTNNNKLYGAQTLCAAINFSSQGQISQITSVVHIAHIPTKFRG